MRKKGIALIAMLAVSVSAFAAACGEETDPPDPTDPKGDVYEDYDPDKQPGGDAFDFAGNYSAPELTIDGKGDDPQWQAITEPLLTYGKRVGDGSGGTTDAVTVRAYRGEKALFFLFDVKDTTLLTYGVTNDDAVTRGDSIEFYIDTKADGGRNPQSDDFQINLGIHGKTRIMQGSGSSWGSWNGLIDYEVSLDGTLNDGDAATDTGYTVEVMIQYKDIMIEKNDTIGLAFGQVDKVRTEDAPTGSATGPWNWFGWTVNGTLVDPQKPNMYILYDKDGNLVSREDIETPPADMAGSVKDKEGNPVAGATVTATIGGEVKTVTTDGRGYFVFEDVQSNSDYTVEITKDGYLTLTATYTKEELRAANGTIVLKDFVFTATANLTYTTLTGTVKNVVDGAVGGATVTLKGTTLSATAATDGTFSLARVPANNGAVTLVVSKAGYGNSETTVEEEVLVANGATALGDVNLSLPAGETGSFGMKSGLFANNRAYITRTLTGVEFCFEGDNNFNGWLELFIDTKESTPERNSTNTQYRFHANGTVEAINDFGNGQFTTEGIVWTVTPVSGAGYTAKAFIPYTTLKISPLEPFGISLGQNNGQNDWDGWNRGDMPGANGEAFVKPEMPTDYIRIGATNRLYSANHNNTLITFGGTVEADGTALAGVTVKIDGTAVATTDANGVWSYVSVPGTNGYTVTYEKTGYVTKTTEIPYASLAGRESWTETAVLEPTKVTLGGTVTGADGAGIEGVTVTVSGDGVNLSATTGADGSYTIEGITVFADVTVTFTKTDYVTVSEKITAATLAGAQSHTLNKILQSSTFEKTVTLSGTVKEGEVALEGVSVTIGTQTTKTNANGEWTVTLSLAYNEETVVTYTLAGYRPAQTTIAANTFMEQTAWSEEKTLVAQTTTVTGTVKNIVNGSVAGVTVTVKGRQTTAVTNADGTFSFEGIRLVDGDLTLSFAKAGYESTEFAVGTSQFAADTTTQIGEISLNLPAVSGGAFATGENKTEEKRGYFVNATVEVTRTLTGVEFRFYGTRKLGAGQIELYLDVKESTGHRDQETSAWRLDLRADGTVGGTHFAGGAFSAEGLLYTVICNSTQAGYRATLLVPYGYLGIGGTEVFGMSLGQWSEDAKDWDGWNWIGDNTFVAPENTPAYLRFGALNYFYRATDNNATVLFTGNAGQEGVTVTVGAQSVITNAQGDWSLIVPATNDALEVVYRKSGYVTKTTAIAAGTLSGACAWNETVMLAVHQVTVSGTVTDENGAPIAGVTVTLTVGSDSRTKITDANGNYSFTEVTTFEDVFVAFEKEGYAAVAATLITQQALANAENGVYTADKRLTATSSVKTITVSGTVVGLEGALQNVTVTVAGTTLTATTGADGTFTLENFKCIDSEIVITLAGHRTQTIVFEASAVGSDETSFAMGELFLAKEYEKLGSAFGVGDAFAHFVPYVTRGKTGFEFKFVGSRAFTGNIEVFVDTKQSKGMDGRDDTDYRFDLRADGGIAIENWGGGTNKTPTPGMTLRIGGTTAAPEVYFTLPYAFLGVTSTEIIGVSFGQFSGGWDGWTLSEEYASMKGADGSMFVKPETPWDYIRIGVDNKPYWSIENDVRISSDYTLHFGRLNDSIHAKITRDNTGVTFDFITLGAFDKIGNDLAAVLLYIDTGEPAGGWGCDYQYKLVSDGRACGKNGAWWGIDNGDDKGTIAFIREDGITRFSFKVLYTDLGISATDVFGFTLVEGWLTVDNGSNEYGANTVYVNGTTHYQVGDAADTANYLRIKADGTIVAASSNSAVTE